MTSSLSARRKAFWLSGAAGVALFAAPAMADELANEQLGQPTTVSEVVVTAAGFEQRIEQAPASISVLARAELEETRFHSLAEALANVEGVDVGGSAGKTGGLNISIRGMPSDYTLILIDGRRQNTAGSTTPNGFGETASSFMPPMSAIERIEVVRGPVSTLYGSDAMGGVVNIITRKVGDAWTGSASADYTIQGDSDFGAIYGVAGYASGPLVSDLLGLTLRGSYAEREESELQQLRADGSYGDITSFGRSPTSYEIWGLGARLNFTPHPDHDLWLEADVNSQWYDNSNGQMGTNTIAGGYADYLEFNREQYVLAHNWRLPFGALESTLSHNFTEKLGRILPALMPVVGGQPRVIESTSTIFDTKLFSQWRNHTFTVGGQYWDAEMTDNVSETPFTFEQWALFVEDEWRFTDSLALTLGVRYDDHSTFGDHVSPRAYLVWNANDYWTIKGGVSSGYKAPRVEQLSPGINGFGAQGRMPLIGTPTLTPETSVSTELAILFDNRDNFRAGVTIFNNEFEDKIASGVPVANCTFGLTEAQYLAGGYPTTNCVDVGFYPTYATYGQAINIDEAVTRGVETTFRWRFHDDWTLTGNYTYTDSEQKSGSAAGQPLVNTPEHMLNANLRWTISDAVSAWVRGEYRSERYRGEGPAKDALGDYESYSLFHLGGSWQVTERVSFNATIYNLLDENFLDYRIYPNPTAANPAAVGVDNIHQINQEPRRLWLSVNLDF